MKESEEERDRPPEGREIWSHMQRQEAGRFWLWLSWWAAMIGGACFWIWLSLKVLS